MSVISILASPPSVHSLRANVKVLNRFARSVAVTSLLIGAVRLAPRVSQAAWGLADFRPAALLIAGPSAVAWSGKL